MRRAPALAVLLSLVGASTALAQGSPSISTGAASNVTSTTATVAGTVNPEGQATQYAFQYGPTIAYGRQTPLSSAGSGTTDQAVTANLTSLFAGTIYHYRIIALSTGGTTAGGDQTFTTTGTPPSSVPFAPVVTTGASQGVGQSGGTVTGTVNPQGLATQYWFQYGTSTNYGYQTAPVSAGSGTIAVAVNALLAALASGQTYHYRLVAQNVDGTTVGNDATFTTATPPPAATKLAVFGATGFVSPSGVTGILAGCIGPSSCNGRLTISRSGVILGQRSSFVIGSDNGGVVHVTLNSLGRLLVRQRHHLRVNVTVGASGAYQTASGVITLVQFS
jgi:hypothetical protein